MKRDNLESILQNRHVEPWTIVGYGDMSSYAATIQRVNRSTFFIRQPMYAARRGDT